MRSFSEFDDSQQDPRVGLVQKRKTIAIITDFFCSNIEYIAFIPTLVYNIFWITYINSLINSTPIALATIDLNKGNTDNTCFDLIRWKVYLLRWTKVSLSKAFMFLCTSKICCGNENDLNLFCVFIKSVTSLIPSLVFMLKLPDVLLEYEGNRKVIYHMDTMEGCDNLHHVLTVYHRFERMYCYFIGGLFAMVILGTILAAMKEVWRSRGYRIK